MTDGDRAQMRSDAAAIVLPDTSGMQLVYMRSDAAAIVLPDTSGMQLVYVLGGYSKGAAHGKATIFDPAAKRVSLKITGSGEAWRELQPMQDPRGDCASVVLNGHFWVFGGERKHAEDSLCDKVSVPVNDWAKATDLPRPRMRFAAAELEGNSYVFGGQDELSHGAGEDQPGGHKLLAW
eukprot:gene33912-6011_t